MTNRYLHKMCLVVGLRRPGPLSRPSFRPVFRDWLPEVWNGNKKFRNSGRQGRRRSAEA